MILGFKTKFPDGTPSNFPAKILLCYLLQVQNRGQEKTITETALGRFYHYEEMVRLGEQGVKPKIHTVRQQSYNRWNKERWEPFCTGIQFATGVRTKSYCQFAYGPCLGVQKIKMYFNLATQRISVYVDERFVEVEQFLQNDGFDNYQQFHDWFYPLIKGATDAGQHCYSGIVIHWTRFKYYFF